MSSDNYLQIKLKYNTFTAAQKRLADFILTNPDFVMRQSISDVAAACNVGDATISRFCRVLGFNGYYDFKLSIQKYLPKDDIDDVSNGDISDDNISDVTKLVLSKNIEAIDETYKLIDEAAIRKSVDLLLNANRIAFLAKGTSLPVAMEGCNRLMRILPNIVFFNEIEMQRVLASQLCEKDVAIVISYSGSQREIVETARTVKSNDAQIICITHYLESPLTQYADV
jgi:DNA-binding MurR/RpiR family transcriptional regulator